MRILIDNGEYPLRNQGDLAMLAVTAARLQTLWPGCRLDVVTTSPVRLRAYAPWARAVAFQEQGLSPARQSLKRAAGLLPPRAARWALGWRDRAGGTGGREAGGGPPPSPGPAPEPVPEAVAHADLVVALGGGYMTDIDRRQARRVMGTLERALDMGVPAVMLGQGLGPLREPDLVAQARRVLPRVDLIALREALVGPRLLSGLGVARDRVVVTGDDAVALGRAQTPRAGLGAWVGVNARSAHYAAVEEGDVGVLRDVVQRFARAHGAGLMPLAVSEDEDRLPTADLCRGHDPVAATPPGLPSPLRTARQVGGCRLLVTATYHLAVFALSQGIPAVCLARSEYYRDKFRGLADRFGAGCAVLDLDDPALAATLRTSLDRAWAEGPSVRPRLLEAADRQIAAGWRTYRRVKEIADGARRSRDAGPAR